VATFAFRALRPTFDLAPFYVAGATRPDGSIHLWARDVDGNLAMDASATVEDAR
jgi:3-methylfumaryl-CoA hydratase